MALVVLSTAVLCVAGEADEDSNKPQQSTTGPVPPAGVEPKALRAFAQDFNTVVLSVPAYLWQHGCGPTAVGMVAGYFDARGYDDLIGGDARSQTYDVNQAIASEGNIANPRHYEDYSQPIDDSFTGILADKSAPPAGDEHPSDCIADFMKTSWSSVGNYYGWSWSSDVGAAFISFVNQRDVRYSPQVQQYTMPSMLTWEIMTNEIDNSRPMVFLVDTGGDGDTDHFVTVVGYRSSPAQQYGCLDTWEPAGVVRWCDFKAMNLGQPWGIWGGWSFNLAPLAASRPLPPDNGCGAGEDVVLTWTAGVEAVAHDVYFGTDFNEVCDADINDATGIYQGRSDVNDYEIYGLGPDSSYYWRVDEIDANDLNNPVRGPVWIFTTIKVVHVPEQYPSIQAALDAALDGVTIGVAPGRYLEKVEFRGRNVVLTSPDPNDPCVVAATIIDGNGTGPVVTFSHGEDANCILTGFVITRGNSSKGGGIYCASSTPTITNCRIISNAAQNGGGMYNLLAGPTIIGCRFIQNSATSNGGAMMSDQSNVALTNCLFSANTSSLATGGMSSTKSTVTLVNCTFNKNVATGWGGAMGLFAGSTATLTNCILWGDRPNEIYNTLNSSVMMTYGDVQGGWQGLGNIVSDPLFADANNGDYHLMSTAGRWDDDANDWVQDANTSRCIDAGHPGYALAYEPDDGNNVRIDMGVYGGTSQASRPPAGWALLADLNNNGVVYLDDLDLWADYWLDEGTCPADLDVSNFVDAFDFALLAEDWGLQTVWK